MKHISLIALVLTGILYPQTGMADNDWKRHPNWLGDFWQTTPEVGMLLGIAPEKIQGKFPAKLHLSQFIDRKSAVEVMGKEAVSSAETRFAKMKHTVISAGKWEAEPTFSGFDGKDEFFFVTKHDGSTFLWFGTPQITLKGAEAHYISGVDFKHDLLLLDFGFSNFRGRTKAGNAVAYRRVSD